MFLSTTKLLSDWKLLAACPKPPEIRDGSFSSSDPSFAVGSMVTYTCNDPSTHELAGKSTLTCQADQTWDSSTPCCMLIGKFRCYGKAVAGKIKLRCYKYRGNADFNACGMSFWG